MPKRIVMVAHTQRPAEVMAGQLTPLVGPGVQVEARSLEQGLGPPEGVDLVLASTALMTSQIGAWLPAGVPVVTAVRTLQRDSWEQVIALPPRTRALLVNDLPDTAVETIALLHELGATHLELIPAYPGAPDLPRVQLALTPGEVQLVPGWVDRVLDLGDRVLDPSTVVDVLTLLGQFDPAANRRVLAYDETVVARPAMRETLRWFSGVRSQLQYVLDAMQDGVVAYNAAGTITLVNRSAETILGLSAWQLVGKSLPDAAAELGLPLPLWPAPAAPILMSFAGRQVVVRASPPAGGETGDGLINLRDVTEIQELERRLRSELRSRGHVARYQFADIVGQSPAMGETIARARRLTHASGSVLIYGESGTGKEMFAQAIHNGSGRSRYPFVAINCAAVPEGLLESELFGYEEGAFTGARRGGKEGLFEQAHGGTVFLDEIGELSPGLQARLLRVLQEREVMRVGATRIRPIDVRIICATNTDLFGQVQAGRFRPDLYYRLNVLTLRLPPLRERREDIPALLPHFLAELGDRRTVPAGVLAVLLAHPWPGNVRELRNCMEYLVTVAEGDFRVADLPDEVRAAPAAVAFNHPVSFPDAGAAGNGGEAVTGVLLGLLGARQGTGRRSLSRVATAAGWPVTEAQVRSLLEGLARDGLVDLRRGRSGARLTPAGLQRLHGLNPVRH